MMVAQPNPTAQDADAAIYAVEQPYAPDTDWPIPLYRAPVELVIGPTPKKTTLNRKDAGPDGVLVSFGGQSVQIRDDADMAEAFKLLAVAPLPTKALDPLPQPYKPVGEPLPIDADVVLKSTSEPLPCINEHTAKYEGGLAMPKFTLRVPMRTPLGQRVLVPICSQYWLGGNTFLYKFEIMEGCVVWWPEDKLSVEE